MATMCEKRCPGCPAEVKRKLQDHADRLIPDGIGIWMVDCHTILPGEKKPVRVDFKVQRSNYHSTAECVLRDTDQLIGVVDLD